MQNASDCDCGNLLSHFPGLVFQRCLSVMWGHLIVCALISLRLAEDKRCICETCFSISTSLKTYIYIKIIRLADCYLCAKIIAKVILVRETVTAERPRPVVIDYDFYSVSCKHQEMCRIYQRLREK